MEQDILLTICGTQQAPECEPETIELTTEGLLAQTEAGFCVSYMESVLTGLEGVKTEFLIAPERIILRRSGALQSEMIFEQGRETQSLYQTEYGALLISIYAKTVTAELSARGGTITLCYTLTIEDTPSGTIDYRITVRPKQYK